MRILVLGAGVVGMTTAYALAKRGCKVTVIDQAASVAAGASFANGAQLSYSFVDPMASPSMLMKLPAILLGKDAALRINTPLDASLIRWGMAFAANCHPAKARQNLEEALLLARQSKQALAELLMHHSMAFRHKMNGKLVVTRSRSKMKEFEKSIEVKRRCGNNVYALTAEECRGVNAELGGQLPDIVGGLYAPDDAVGDARRFADALGVHAASQYGVEIKLKRTIRSILFADNEAVGVRTNKGDFTADGVIVCLGAAAANTLRSCGIKLPIIPVKGYSVSAPASKVAPRVSLTDADNKIVFARLESEMRIAGIADFDGCHAGIRPDRLDALKQTAQRVMPDVADYSHCCSGWAGLRPMTPNGLPLTGPTRIKNLYLNTGHGMFGWTFACGSAERLADQIMGETRSKYMEQAA